MIKCGDKLEGKPQCILYSKDGSKVLGRFSYSKHGGKEGAKKAAGEREGQIQFFKKKSLEAVVEQFGAAPLLAYVAKRQAELGNAVLKDELVAYVEKAKWMGLPKGWTFGSRESFWKSVGGSVTKCMAKIAGVEGIDDKGAFCAALKDRMKGTTKWRGPEKKKSFEEEVEEALEMLKKDEQTEKPKTEEPKVEEGATLSDMLEGVDLADLEQFLIEWGQETAAEEESPAEEVAAEKPPEELKEEPKPEEEIPEEWEHNFLNFVRVEHQRRQAAIQEAIFGPAEEEE